MEGVRGAELFADGECDEETLLLALEQVKVHHSTPAWLPDCVHAVRWAMMRHHSFPDDPQECAAFARSAISKYLSSNARRQSAANNEPAVQARLLRCIFGNPYRPVSVGPSWLTSTAVALAEGIYADRTFDRLPILADALEDAGCGHADILAHCRGDGPHARGCWVVDLLLGKE
jgi:hypothetical protein